MLRRAALLFVVATTCAAAPQPAAAAVIDSGMVLRAEGRSPVLGGRVDTAYRQALDEAFRRGLLDALRVIAPERQNPLDLETWQESILSRAADFVGAWRVLSQEDQDDFLTLSVELEIYQDKLARAARATGVATAVAAVRVMVLSSSLPIAERAADEELDAGRAAAVALESELARRGAIIVATTEREPWDAPSGASSEGSRVALAAAAGKKYDADAVLLVELVRRGEGVVLDAQLIAAVSETTLAAARAEIVGIGDRPLPEAFALAARQVASICAPRLSAARTLFPESAPHRQW